MNRLEELSSGKAYRSLCEGRGQSISPTANGRETKAIATNEEHKPRERAGVDKVLY